MIRSLYTKVFFTAVGLFLIGVGAPSPAVAQSGGWVSCGDAGGWCVINTTDPVRLRYGSGEDWTITTAGVGRDGGLIPCNNSLGDVKSGAKTCEYQILTGMDQYVAENTYKCGTEGTNCFVNGDKDRPYYMKYGTDDAWIMVPVAPNAQGNVACSIHTFGYDPVPNVHKHCEAGIEYSDITGWEICSGGERPCTTDKSVVQLVRYGQGNDGSNHTYREVAANKVNCGLDTFVVDPMNNVVKSCYVATVPDDSLEIISVKGQWKQIIGHNDKMAFKTAIGVTGSRAETKTSEWNLSVTTAIEAEANALFAKQTTSLSFTASGGESRSLTEALEQSTLQELSVSCTARDGEVNVGLFQWTYEVEENCAVSGTCASSSSIQTRDTWCVFHPDISLIKFRPVCRPGCCANRNCTTCMTEPEACTVMINPQFAD
ncbi:hypothetical protein [Roseobacter litoralis]|uniref:hypothetical protein n=1 Tax=Roseobacter litoralis TaxID=42443 RepID=UPI0024955969|nr:hypothetical protein [Roseobacter litoralis]